MTIYFSWCNKNETFDTQKHIRHDVDILSFDISHNEGELALLKMTVVNFAYPKSTSCFLVHKEREDQATLLFHGELCHFPIKRQSNAWILEFRACVDPKEWGTLLKTASLRSQRMREFEEFKDDCPLTLSLQDQKGLYAFDRATGSVTFSDLLKGREFFTPKHVVKESVHVTFSELPYASVELNLTVKWRQEDYGEVNILPTLAQAFDEGMINTFTGKDFTRTFPKVGDRLSKGDSGCQVVESELIPVSPSSTGLLDLYPAQSPSLWTRLNEHEEPKCVRFSRQWFRGRLVVAWQYKQTRKEHVTLTIHNRVDAPVLRPSKKINLTVKKPLPSKSASFFGTYKGAELLASAIRFAEAFLAGSSRCVEVSFTIPFEEGLTLSLNHSVDLAGVLNLSTSVIAKVIHYRINRKGTMGFVFVRCALAIGMEQNEEKSHNPLYVEEGGINHDIVPISTFSEPVQRILDETIQKCRPQGVSKTDFLHTLSLVKSVCVKNKGSEQVALLLNHQYPGHFDMKKILSQHPTRFEIHLQDLRTAPLLEERIVLKDRFYTPAMMVNFKEVFYAS